MWSIHVATWDGPSSSESQSGLGERPVTADGFEESRTEPVAAMTSEYAADQLRTGAQLLSYEIDVAEGQLTGQTLLKQRDSLRKVT